MKNVMLPPLVAVTLLAAPLGCAAPANAAPPGPAAVDATIMDLRAEGFTVIVNRTGSADLKQCTLSAVRPGQLYSRTDSGVPGADGKLLTTVLSKTVYVDLSC
jgi:hypothetical protein